MNQTKCVCCDGYGQRARPAFLPGEGPVNCVACKGQGLLGEIAWQALPVTAGPFQFDQGIYAPGLLRYDGFGSGAVICGGQS